MNKNAIILLISLKNASIYKKPRICIKYCKHYSTLLQLLYLNGYIQTFFIQNKKNKKILHIFLREYYNTSLLTQIKIYSTPALKYTILYAELLSLRKNINKTMFITSSQGILSHNDCLKQKIGGMLLFLL